MSDATVYCFKCGAQIDAYADFCSKCGAQQRGAQPAAGGTPPMGGPPAGGRPPMGGPPVPGRGPNYQGPGGTMQQANSQKMAAGLCGILIGAFGIHKFILGFTGAGLTMLLVTVLTLGIGGIVMGTIGLIEGIIYLTKSDDEFYQIYMVGKKAWF